MITSASMGKASTTSGNAENNVLPIDAETISEDVKAVLKMKISTSTRKDIFASMPGLIGHLNLLLDEDLGVDEDEDVGNLCRDGRRHLDPTNHPTEETPSFGAFFFLQEIATLTRRLVLIYARRNGLHIS